MSTNSLSLSIFARTICPLGICVFFLLGCGATDEPSEASPEPPAPGNEETETPPAKSAARSQEERAGVMVQSGNEPGQDEVPEIVAVVDDRPIPRESYLRKIQSLRSTAVAKMRIESGRTGEPQQLPMYTAEQYNQILENLVNEKVTLVLAGRLGIEVDEARVQATIDDKKAALRTEQEFYDILLKMNTTEDRLRQDYRDTYVRQEYGNLFGHDCSFTEEQLALEYERRRAAGLMVGPETVDFWQILVRVTPFDGEDVWETAKFKIMGAEQRILTGEDFSKVALEISEDPDVKDNLGLIRYRLRSRLSPDVEDLLFSLPIGRLSAPLRTEYGWYLFQVKMRRPDGVRELDHIREELMDRLMAECKRAEIDEAIAKGREELNVRILYHFGDR